MSIHLVKPIHVFKFVVSQPGRRATFNHIAKQLTKVNLGINLGLVVSGIERLLNSGELTMLRKSTYYARVAKGKPKVFRNSDLKKFLTWLRHGQVCLICYGFTPTASQAFDSIALSDENHHRKTGNPFRIQGIAKHRCETKNCKGWIEYDETEITNSYFVYISQT